MFLAFFNHMLVSLLVMKTKRGKLIVIDGIDGSGKATQVKKLRERLQKEGVEVETLDFPRYYDNFFGKLVGEGLKGKLGNWVDMHPKVTSVIYAADRFESSEQIRNWLEEGKIVILDRYVSSNQIHQGGKISDEKERKEFMQWLDTMEHEIFGIPRPDLILYLDLLPEISQKLLKKKSNQYSKKYLDGKKDQHEDNFKHLKAARETGLRMAAENNNWHKIECFIDSNILSIEEIHEKIYRVVKGILNKK